MSAYKYPFHARQRRVVSSKREKEEKKKKEWGKPANPVPFPAPSLPETSELRKEQYPGTSRTSVLNASKAASLSAPPGQWLVIWHACPGRPSPAAKMWPCGGGCGAICGLGIVTGSTRRAVCEVAVEAGACSEMCIWPGREKEALLLIMSGVVMTTPTIWVAPRAASRGGKAVNGFIGSLGRMLDQYCRDLMFLSLSMPPLDCPYESWSLYECTRSSITCPHSQTQLYAVQNTGDLCA